jgi:hypothetical protein
MRVVVDIDIIIPHTDVWSSRLQTLGIVATSPATLGNAVCNLESVAVVWILVTAILGMEVMVVDRLSEMTPLTTASTTATTRLAPP